MMTGLASRSPLALISITILCLLAGVSAQERTVDRLATTAYAMHYTTGLSPCWCAYDSMGVRLG